MAHNKKKPQDLAAALTRLVNADDVLGAKRLLFGNEKPDKKTIDAKSQEINAMLFDAAGLGNKSMVAFSSERLSCKP